MLVVPVSQNQVPGCQNQVPVSQNQVPGCQLFQHSGENDMLHKPKLQFGISKWYYHNVDYDDHYDHDDHDDRDHDHDDHDTRGAKNLTL